MDYKQKYEQALENLKRIKNANRDNKELVDFIEYQYPELKESEDEKIRKELIEFICWAVDRGSITEKQRERSNLWIAWLEKQGLQKQRKEWNADDVWNYNQIMDILQEYNRTELMDWLEKQFEKKPTWSKKDEKMWSTISDLLWDGYKLSDKKVSWNKIRCWLLPKIKSIKDGVQPQPKQEWSEEDEKMLNSAIWHINNSTHNGLSGNGSTVCNWLKSLKERMKGE